MWLFPQLFNQPLATKELKKMQQVITDMDVQVKAVVAVVDKMAEKIDALNAQIATLTNTTAALAPDDSATVTADTSALANAVAVGNSKL